MKYLLWFFVILGVWALAYEHYVLGVASIICLGVLHFAVSFLAEKVMEVHTLMPRYGLNISETLDLAKDSWFFRKGVDFPFIAFFYAVLLLSNRHFDVRVNLGLINAFEHNCRFIRLQKSHQYLPAGKAVYYYAMMQRLYPLYPTIWSHHISRAIIVTKKPSATQEQVEEGIIPNFLKMIFRWFCT